jgi:CheY-like chemotaxis protein
MYDADVVERETLRVLVYSDDRDVRAAVMAALGSRPHPDLGRFEYIEAATEPRVLQVLDDLRHTSIDLVILDGEATPVGGLGIARQMKDEIFNAPPVLVLTGRPQDAWLATWSRAEAVLPHPIDPLLLAQAVIDLVTNHQPAAR